MRRGSRRQPLIRTPCSPKWRSSSWTTSSPATLATSCTWWTSSTHSTLTSNLIRTLSSSSSARLTRVTLVPVPYSIFLSSPPLHPPPPLTPPPPPPPPPQCSIRVNHDGSLAQNREVAGIVRETRPGAVLSPAGADLSPGHLCGHHPFHVPLSREAVPLPTAQPPPPGHRQISLAGISGWPFDDRRRPLLDARATFEIPPGQNLPILDRGTITVTVATRK